MNFHDKLKKFLNEEVKNVADDIEPTPIDKINDDPEKKQGDEIQISPEVDVYSNKFISENFIQKVKPTIGEINKDKLMIHHIQLAHKNKDMFVFKTKSKTTVPFYAFDRDEYVAYVANTEYDDDIDEDLKRLNDKIDKVYTREQSELVFEDYNNLAIDNIISITTNMPETLEPSDKSPSIKIPEEK